MYRAEGSLSIRSDACLMTSKETRAAISRRIGKRERTRTTESPYDRRSEHDEGSEHERQPDRAAEAGEQGAGEQGAGVAACVAQAGFSET